MSLKSIVQIFSVVVLILAKNVTIFHSSEFNGEFYPIRTRTGAYVGGFARLLYYLDKNRDGFYLMAGNIIHQPYSTHLERIEIESELLSILKPTAICLAYNEFRLTAENFDIYKEKFNFPVVSTNFRLHNSSVDVVLSNDIVVMSYAHNDFKYQPLIQTSDNIQVEDMIYSLNKRIEFHKKNNQPMIFIAVGCFGIDTAKDIAKNVNGIDIVISGCSKIMQWNEGDPPENIKKDSEYPLVYKSKQGKRVLIAHTYGT